MDGCDAASSEPHFVAPQQRMRIAKESGAALACELHRWIGYDRSLGKLADAAGCAREGAMKLHAPACPLNLESHLIRVQAITDAPRRPTGNACWNVPSMPRLAASPPGPQPRAAPLSLAMRIRCCGATKCGSLDAASQPSMDDCQRRLHFSRAAICSTSVTVRPRFHRASGQPPLSGPGGMLV